MEVEGKRILVVGAARSGLAAAHILARRGAIVTVTDRKPPGEFRDALSELIKDKAGLELGVQREETFLSHQAIVISPGVPWDLPELEAARQRNIPIYPEVEVATWFLTGTMVGVTGSNGKTTTTTLLGNMLSASGFPTFVGGNIGNALSSAVGRAQPGTKFVTELSSFQLEAIHDLRPQVAVMLNLSPNHLDRHPSLEAYAQAKRRIFRNQGEGDFAVLNADDPWVAGLRAEVHSRPVFFSRKRELPSGVFVSRGGVYYRVRHLERMLFETREVPLRGDFNLEDVLAATTAACVLGADFTAIRKAVREFKAVEHRLEFVREIQGVQFFNNSKATSVDATVKTLGAFEGGVHLILGGKDKGAPYTPLLPLIKNRVREILLIGAAARTIAAQLSGSTELVQAGDLATAVSKAFAHAQPGDTVLLAPACSSFDQFKDYEERGRVFKELVKKLDREVWEGKVTLQAAPVLERKHSEAAGEIPEAATTRLEPGVSEPAPAVHVSSVDQRVEPSTKDLGESAADLKARPVEPAPQAPVQVQPEVEAEPTGKVMAESEPIPVVEPESDLLQESAPPAIHEAEPAGAALPPAPAINAAQAGTEDNISEHPIELTYIFEVDAVEMPAAESQVAPEYEPSIPVSTGLLEASDEEALPYETRAKEFARPESRVARGSKDLDAKSEAPPAPRQPKLFDGSKE